MDSLTVFRRVIKDRRAERKLSVREAATKLGMARNQYHEIETGKRAPSVSSLIKIADFYSVSLDFALLGGCMKGQKWA